jgi:hypothetical protein
MFERICTGETTKHTFVTEGADDKTACPECGADPKTGFAIKVPDEPFAGVTEGADQSVRASSALQRDEQSRQAFSLRADRAREAGQVLKVTVDSESGELVTSTGPFTQAG